MTSRNILTPVGFGDIQPEGGRINRGFITSIPASLVLNINSSCISLQDLGSDGQSYDMQHHATEEGWGTTSRPHPEAGIKIL